MKTSPQYEQDYYAWALHNARLLKARQLDEVDFEHLVEELEDTGKSERRALESHIRNLLLHMLKWQCQPHVRGASWRQSIRNAGVAIDKLTRESPSLKAFISPSVADEYPPARADAIDETGLKEDVFPGLCPYSEAELFDPGFWPE